jgi:hypothetical protein
MNANHYFSIGKDHAICQDYAISKLINNGGCAILSDGCSSSPSTDIGSRLLAMAAYDVFLNFIVDIKNAYSILEFKKETVTRFLLNLIDHSIKEMDSLEAGG